MDSQGLLFQEVPIFDAQLSARKAREGMFYAAAKEDRVELLSEARDMAIELAQQNDDRCLTADDVVYWYAQRGVDLPRLLGNAMGSLFSSKHWIFTGRYVKSRRVSRHSNTIRVWRLR